MLVFFSKSWEKICSDSESLFFLFGYRDPCFVRIPRPLTLFGYRDASVFEFGYRDPSVRTPDVNLCAMLRKTGSQNFMKTSLHVLTFVFQGSA